MPNKNVLAILSGVVTLFVVLCGRVAWLQTYGREQVSPTRDTRLRWMQSVIGCNHYVSGASEQDYINKADGPGVIFVERETIANSGDAYIGGHD